MASSSSSSPEPGVRSVTLRKGITGTYVEGRTQGYLLQLEVTETVGVDPYLFVFQRINDNDEFSNVASPADLEEYPVGEPDDGSPFFRLHEASLVFRNLTQLEKSVEDVEKDIEGLVETLNQLDRLQESTVVISRITPTPTPSTCEDTTEPESSSSCDSSSGSSSPLRRAVRLQISDVVPTSLGIEQGYRVTIDVLEAVGLPEEIFVFQRQQTASGINDEFSNVASPADLEEYPVDEPDEEGAFFRLKHIDLVYRSLELLEENLNDLKHDICMLLETLAQMDRLTSEIVVIDERCSIGGTDPCPPLPGITARLIGDYRDPTPDDDALHGYGIGSVWTNVVSQQTYVLINNENGEAIWIPLTGTAIKHNFIATTNPTINDDVSEHYGPGSHWYNTLEDRLFICIDATEGAAVWREIALTKKHNFSATTDPGLTDDKNAGYTQGSEWYNTVSGSFFVCVDNTPGAAIWVNATGGGSGGGAGLGLYQTPGPKLNVQVDDDSTTITVDNNLVAATPTKIDAEITAIVTNGNDADSGIRITLKPSGRGDGAIGDRYVMVFINGQKVSLGDGVKTKDCFFSDSPSAPYSPKYLADIEPGDKLIWNGLVVKFDLDAEDVVSLHYTTLQLGGSSSSSSGAPGSSGIWGIGVWGEFVWGVP